MDIMIPGLLYPSYRLRKSFLESSEREFNEGDFRSLLIAAMFISYVLSRSLFLLTPHRWA